MLLNILHLLECGASPHRFGIFRISAIYCRFDIFWTAARPRADLVYFELQCVPAPIFIAPITHFPVFIGFIENHSVFIRHRNMFFMYLFIIFCYNIEKRDVG